MRRCIECPNPFRDSEVIWNFDLVFQHLTMDYLSSILKTMQTQREGGRKFLVFVVYLATLVGVFLKMI